MRTRPRHLFRRPTQGFSFGHDAVYIKAGVGVRNNFGLWPASDAERIPVRLAQAPLNADSNRDANTARRMSMATFYLVEQPVQPIRTGDEPTSADRIEWSGDTYTVQDLGRFGDLLEIIGEWEDPQSGGPGYQDTAIDLAVRKLIVEASDLPGTHVIPGNGPGPSPDTVFATVLNITNAQQGGPAEQESAYLGSHVLETRSNRFAAYSIQWYRNGAATKANRAVDWLGTSLAADFATGLEIRIHEYNTLRDLDAVVSSEWEERLGLDLTVAYFSDRRWNSDCIDEAPFIVRVE